MCWPACSTSAARRLGRATERIVARREDRGSTAPFSDFFRLPWVVLLLNGGTVQGAGTDPMLSANLPKCLTKTGRSDLPWYVGNAVTILDKPISKVDQLLSVANDRCPAVRSSAPTPAALSVRYRSARPFQTRLRLGFPDASWCSRFWCGPKAVVLSEDCLCDGTTGLFWSCVSDLR